MSPNQRRLAYLAGALFLISTRPTLSANSPEPRAPSTKDRCLLCGMLVAPHAAWVSQLQFENGTTAYFDGNKCLFRYLLSREKFAPELQKEKISATYVTTYYDLGKIALEDAWFVVGSDVKGPMGHELVPFRTHDEADDFMADHNGQRIVRATDVNGEILATLKK